MLFTHDSIAAIPPRSYPFFLVEDGSMGFAVKVLKSGIRRFYYRKKTDGRMVEVCLGEELEQARARYNAIKKREKNLRATHKEALEFATGIVNFGPVLKPAPTAGPVIENPLFYSGVTFELLAQRFIAEHVMRNLSPATARNYVAYLKKVELDLGRSKLVRGVLSVGDARQLLKAYINSMKLSTPT
jgi:hypothetical protein